MNAPSANPSRKDERAKRAQRLLSRTTFTRVSDDEFYRVLDAIDNPPAPTDYLVGALR